MAIVVSADQNVVVADGVRVVAVPVEAELEDDTLDVTAATLTTRA